jgi:hypothetical protein
MPFAFGVHLKALSNFCFGLMESLLKFSCRILQVTMLTIFRRIYEKGVQLSPDALCKNFFP